MFDEFIPVDTDRRDAAQVIQDGSAARPALRLRALPRPPTSRTSIPSTPRSTSCANARATSTSRSSSASASPSRTSTGGCPRPYFDLYDPAEIRAALRKSLQDGTIIPGNGEYFDVPPMSVPSPDHPQIAANIDLWADYIHGYLAAVSYADAKIGEVLDALEADPALAADTAILLWSDHGYHLGDKDRWGKFTHWREATAGAVHRRRSRRAGRADRAAGRQPRRHLPDRARPRWASHVPAGSASPATACCRSSRTSTSTGTTPGPARASPSRRSTARCRSARTFPGEGDLRYTRYPDGTEELYDLSRRPERARQPPQLRHRQGPDRRRRRAAHADERADGRASSPRGLSDQRRHPRP